MERWGCHCASAMSTSRPIELISVYLVESDNLSVSTPVTDCRIFLAKTEMLNSHIYENSNIGEYTNV